MFSVLKFDDQWRNRNRRVFYGAYAKNGHEAHDCVLKSETKTIWKLLGYSINLDSDTRLGLFSVLHDNFDISIVNIVTVFQQKVVAGHHWALWAQLKVLRVVKAMCIQLFLRHNVKVQLADIGLRFLCMDSINVDGQKTSDIFGNKVINV